MFLNSCENNKSRDYILANLAKNTKVLAEDSFNVSEIVTRSDKKGLIAFPIFQL